MVCKGQSLWLVDQGTNQEGPTGRVFLTFFYKERKFDF